MKYGYARVSTPDQCLNLQLDALRLYGVDRIYQEKISGKKKIKPILNSLIAKLRAGDQLIVWKLDRLGRKSGDLIKLQESLEEKEIALVSLTENLDTSTPTGRFSFQVICNIAELERNTLSQRTSAGLMAARKKGRIGGRPTGLTEKGKKKAKTAVTEYKKYLQYKYQSIDDVCAVVEVSRATLYKYLKLEGITLSKKKKLKK